MVEARCRVSDTLDQSAGRSSLWVAKELGLQQLGIRHAVGKLNMM